MLWLTDNLPRTREEWEARVNRQNKWDVCFRDGEFGSVQLVDGKIVVEGEKSHAIHNLLDRLRRDGMDDTALFRSLPHRLRGHVFVAFPEGDSW
jgi:hypothetical protein